MSFVIIPGLKGKVFVPEQKEGAPKKHPCEDCYCCQMCSDDRCDVCLGQKKVPMRRAFHARILNAKEKARQWTGLFMRI